MFTIRTPEGELQTVVSLDGYDGCEVVHEHDRAPEEHEEWDAVEGLWKTNEARKADTDAGIDHILKAHVHKALEAAMILSGIPLTCGMVFEEAQALGIPIETLAATIHKKGRVFREAEVDRRTKKAPA